MPKAKKAQVNIAIIVALITACFTFSGTIISALLASPLLTKWLEGPAAAQELEVRTGDGKTEITQVSLAISKQLLTRQELLDLDENEFFIDRDLEVAVKQVPNDEWVIDTYDKLPTISVFDVPMIALGMGMYSNLYFEPKQPVIFGVRHREGHEVLLDENSSIASTPMNLNLYENREYLKASLESQRDMMARLDPSQGALFDMMLTDEMIDLVQASLTKSFTEYLDNQLPLSRRVHSGVYVMPINKEDMESSLYLELSPDSTMLDRAQNYITFSGIFNAGSMQNIIADQKHGIASFKASVELENVKIDGNKTNATLNNVGFIVAGEKRAILVVLIYLDIDELSTWEELQILKDSLRFTK